MKEYLINVLKKLDIPDGYAENLIAIISTIFLFLLAFVSYKIVKSILINIATKLTQKSKTKWDDFLLQNRFFHRISLLVPAIVFHFLIPLIFNLEYKIIDILTLGIEVYSILIIVSILSSFLDTLDSIFSTTTKAKSKSIKNYIQVVKIIIYFVALIVLFSTLTGRDIITLLASLGAFAAVLLLIFQDAIKGLAAGVQISANDMVRIGDWISMEKYRADGTVIEIALTTIKIQNWDKTISMVPAYALVSESFNNWRGMEESGGRRIKRSLFIDVSSIHFLSTEEHNELEKIKLIQPYIKEKSKELSEYNSSIQGINSNDINNRKLTNIGTFRRYLEEYIKDNQKINHKMTFMVRQLQSSEKGLPLEIYAFSKIKSWKEYESVQADIFDHIFAAVHTFNLRIFQNPTGKDFQSLKS